MRALILCALAVTLAQAASITWTGIAEDNQWFNHINWSPDQVPGPNDDVTIPSGIVQVTQATGVNSLQMGTLVDAPANLTLFQAFVVGNGGMQVQANGNLIINTGLQQVFGQVQVGGTLEFIDGTLGGAWSIAPRAYANLGNANMKGFSGCSFTSQGQLSLGGVIVLNQSSTFSLASPTVANTNLIIQNGDGSQVSFDASQAAFTYSTGTFTIQAPVTLGQYTLQSGNMSILDSMSFTASFNVPANSYVAVLGNAVFNASAGFTGAGVVTFGSTSATVGSSSFAGFVNLIGGDVVFMAESDINVLTVQGGNAVFMAKMWPQQLNLISGTTAGTGVVIAGNLLVASKGFSLGSAIRVNKTATFMASILSFGTSAGLTIDGTANATVTGTLLLTGPPSVPGVTNNGKFLGSAAVSSQNINIQGSGSFTVQNKLTIGSATFSQAKVELNGGASFSGTNSFLTVGKISNIQGGAVKAVIGSYTFSCPAECDNVNTPNSNPPTSGFMFSA